MSLFPEFDESGSGWSRSRAVFLSVTLAATALGLYLVREVLLPFLLALIIAYVLFPVVRATERRTKAGRGAAILLVYAGLVGVTSVAVSLIAPRLAVESISLGREVPAIVRRAVSEQGPKVEAFVRDRLGGTPEESFHEVTTPSKLDGPAFRVRPLADGSFAVFVERGIVVDSDHQGRQLVLENDKPNHPPSDVEGWVNQGMQSFRRYVEKNSFELIALAQRIVAGLSRGIFLLFMVLMVAGYLMATSEGILAFFRSLLPKAERPAWDQLLRRVDRGLSGVVRGQLLICVVNGVLSALGFWLFGLKYWPILSLVAMVFSIIPIFGAILSSIPAVLIGLTQDVWTALWVLVWIIGIHQVEANLLNPKIIGAAAKIHPVLVVFSLLVGEHYFGLWGALFAVPVLSIVQSVFNHYRFLHLEDAGPDSLGVRELLARSDGAGGRD